MVNQKQTLKYYLNTVWEFLTQYRSASVTIGLILIILAQSIYQREFLEFLKIILSAQMVIVAFALYFVIRFQHQISEMLPRIKLVKFPGGETQFHPTKEEKENLPDSLETLAEKTSMTALSQREINQPEKELREKINRAENTANYWLLKYLTRFLTPLAASVLTWISRRKGEVTKEDFFRTVPGITDLTSNDLIIEMLEALQEFGLVSVADKISLTQRGQRFVTIYSEDMPQTLNALREELGKPE